MFSQALLDQISHADTDRVARALEALQQHTMAVALLYTSDTTITAEVTSIKVKMLYNTLSLSYPSRAFSTLHAYLLNEIKEL